MKKSSCITILSFFFIFSNTVFILPINNDNKFVEPANAMTSEIQMYLIGEYGNISKKVKIYGKESDACMVHGVWRCGHA